MNQKLFILLIILLIIVFIFCFIKNRPKMVESFNFFTNWFDTERSANAYLDQSILFYRNIRQINQQSDNMFNAIMGNDIAYNSLVYPGQPNSYKHNKGFMEPGEITDSTDIWLENANRINEHIIEISRLSNNGRASIYSFYQPSLGFRNRSFIRLYNNSNGWTSQVTTIARIGANVIEQILKERDWCLGVKYSHNRNESIIEHTINFIKSYILPYYDKLNNLITLTSDGTKKISLHDSNGFTLSTNSNGLNYNQKHYTHFIPSETQMDIFSIDVQSITQVNKQSGGGYIRIYAKNGNQYEDFSTENKNLKNLSLRFLSDISKSKKINLETLIFRNMEWDINTLANSNKSVYIICKSDRSCLKTRNNKIGVYDNDTYYCGIHKYSLMTKYYACIKNNAPVSATYNKNYVDNNQLFIKWSLIPSSITNVFRLYCQGDDSFLAYGNHWVAQDNFNVLRQGIPLSNFNEQPSRMYSIKSHFFYQQMENNISNPDNSNNILEDIKKETLWLIERDSSDYNTYTIKHYNTGYQQIYTSTLVEQVLDINFYSNSKTKIRKFTQPYREKLINISLEKTHQSSSDMININQQASVSYNKFIIVPCEPKKKNQIYHDLSRLTDIAGITTTLNSQNNSWYSPITKDTPTTQNYTLLGVSPKIETNGNLSPGRNSELDAMNDLNTLNILNSYNLSKQANEIDNNNSTEQNAWFGTDKGQGKDWWFGRRRPRSEKECQRHAEKNNYVAWGRRHASQTCWFYKDFFNHHQRFPASRHTVYCTNPKESSIQGGCRIGSAITFNNNTKKGIPSSKHIYLTGSISDSGVGYNYGLNNFVNIKQTVKGVPPLPPQPKNIWSINVPGIGINNRPIRSLSGLTLSQCKQVCQDTGNCSGINYNPATRRCHLFDTMDQQDLRTQNNSITSIIPSRIKNKKFLGTFRDTSRRRVPYFLGHTTSEQECINLANSRGMTITGFQWTPACGKHPNGHYRCFQCFGTYKSGERKAKELGENPFPPYFDWGRSGGPNGATRGGAWHNSLYESIRTPNIPIPPSNSIERPIREDNEHMSRPITISTQVYDYNSTFISNFSFFSSNWFNLPQKSGRKPYNWDITNKFLTHLNRYEYSLEKKDLQFLNVNAFAQVINNTSFTDIASRIIQKTEMDESINSNVGYLFNLDKKSFGYNNFKIVDNMGANNLTNFMNSGEMYIGQNIFCTDRRFKKGRDYGMSPLRNYIWFTKEINLNTLKLSFEKLSDFLSKYTSLINIEDPNINKMNRIDIIEDLEVYKYQAIGANINEDDNNLNLYDSYNLNNEVRKIMTISDTAKN